MLDKIELLTKMSNAHLGNLSSCQCENNSSAFEIVTESLLKAVADK